MMHRLVSILAFGLAASACQPAQEGEAVASVKVDDGAAGPGPTPPAGPTIASQVESACRSVIFENTPLTDCIASPERHRIATVLAGPDGNYGGLGAFAASRDARTIAFAVNAGMFDEGGDPVGYYVEAGERKKELNTAKGEGNFHMLPNGVFYGTGDRWNVRTADDFKANVSDRPQFGTQSGPMLVIDGRLHPEITMDGPSRTIRNAVGVDEAGRAHFVISSAPISFGKLARFYRDALKVKNALYLDGSVSQLWNPATERIDGGAPIGPILVVERKVPDDE